MVSTAEPIYKDVARKLKAEREAQGLTQEYMAQKLGMTLAGYGRYETCERRIPIAELKRAAEVFGKPVSYFFGEEKPPDDLAAYGYKSLSEESKEYIKKTIAFLKAQEQQQK